MKQNGWPQLSLLLLAWLRKGTSSSECQPSITLATVLTLSFQGPISACEFNSLGFLFSPGGTLALGLPYKPYGQRIFTFSNFYMGR